MDTELSLSEWITNQLNKRGWSHRELARRAGVTGAQVSRVVGETRGAGPEFCKAIAYAFNESPEKVFVIAGLLPDMPEEKVSLIEANRLFAQLSDDEKEIILAQMRALARRNRDAKKSHSTA